MNKKFISFLLLMIIISSLLLSFTSCFKSSEEKLLEQLYKSNLPTNLQKSFSSIRLETVSTEGKNTYYQDRDVRFLKLNQSGKTQYAILTDDFAYLYAKDSFRKIITEISSVPDYWSQLDYSFILNEKRAGLEDDGNEITLKTNISLTIAESLSQSKDKTVNGAIRTSVFDSGNYSMKSESITLFYTDGTSIETQSVKIYYDGENPSVNELNEVKNHISESTKNTRTITFVIEKENGEVDQIKCSVPEGDGFYYTGYYKGVTYVPDNTRSSADNESFTGDLTIYLIRKTSAAN